MQSCCVFCVTQTVCSVACRIIHFVLSYYCGCQLITNVLYFISTIYKKFLTIYKVDFFKKWVFCVVGCAIIGISFIFLTREANNLSVFLNQGQLLQ